MAQLNTNLPAPSADGVGAWVDVSAYGALKTILCSSDADAVVTIEMSNAATANDASAAPVVGFPSGRGTATLKVAARWMRVRVSGYNPYVGGDITVDVSGTDDGTDVATLIATAGNGTGAGVDISGLATPFKTVHVGNSFRGSLQIEASNDSGVTWTQLVTFDGPGQKSKVFSAQFLRCKRNGVPQNSPGLPVVNVGLCSDGGGGGGGGGGGDLGWYGTGVDGDHVTVGDESQSRDMYYNDLTIAAGHSYSTNGYKLAVAGTLTIEEGGVLHNSASGVSGAPSGTLLGGGDGGTYSLQSEVARVGAAGSSPSWWPLANAPGSGGDGGQTTNEDIPFNAIAGGAGGTPNSGYGAGPYTIEQIASGDGVCGGAGGGGGGTNGNPSATGPGGGGGGVMVLKVRTFDVPDSAIQCKGADGGAGTGAAGGGGGGQGGVILIITDDATAPVCDVSGGAGGAGVGAGSTDGTAGDEGLVIAISPVNGPL